MNRRASIVPVDEEGMKMDGRRRSAKRESFCVHKTGLSLWSSCESARRNKKVAVVVMAMATQALLSLTPPSFASSLPATPRCLTPCFPLFPRCISSLNLSSATGGSQRRVFQVSATAAQSEPVPPPTPEADITPAAPPKPTLKKGQIVRVDKEKYLNSVEYLSVGHPPYFTGLDYIYEDRGEVLNIRFFDHGEYALIAWAGIPTSPAWLPTYMLIKADRLSYKRQ